MLQALITSPDGLTRAQLEEKAPGVSATAANLGPADGRVSAENGRQGSLLALGLVRVEVGDEDGRGAVRWLLTPEGEAEAGRHVARPKTKVRVPRDVLDDAVRHVKASRVHSIDSFTDDDLAEVRSLLGARFADFPLVLLRQAVVNRRKQGAYTDRARSDGLAAARLLKRFGNDLCPGCAARIRALLGAGA